MGQNAGAHFAPSFAGRRGDKGMIVAFLSQSGDRQHVISVCPGRLVGGTADHGPVDSLAARCPLRCGDAVQPHRWGALGSARQWAVGTIVHRHGFCLLSMAVDRLLALLPPLALRGVFDSLQTSLDAEFFEDVMHMIFDGMGR